MANEPVGTSIQTQYTDHLAAALAANQAEQAALTARLNKLQADEKWLAAALADTPQGTGAEPTLSLEPARPALSTPPSVEGTDEAAVPLPRTEKTAVSAAGAKKATPATKNPAAKKTAARAGAAPARKAAAKKPAARKTAAAGAGKAAKAEPTLGQLLSAILSKQPGEPKKVSEIQSELEATHPKRATSVQTVRNALQKLVEKEEFERASQQGTVFYTWPVSETAPALAGETKTEAPAPAAV
ncbi:hypothetical protein [Streptomyces zhihengii]|uniref:hypothetical protein n=1 Tax=Streptomyces zhihengii TaxID=1818004 RepID=UPI0033A7F40B